MNKEHNKKKAFIWNMIGSTCYSGSSFLYLLVVTRVCGAVTAGFFSLSYATAQLLLTVGRYGMRTYQATDLTEKYAFREYRISRMITCALMMLIGIIYSGASFSGDYIVISIFVILMKMVDAVEDVYHGNLQQKYHVEVMGRLLALRSLYSAVAFVFLLVLTKNLYVACTLTALSSLALCLVVNRWGTYKHLGRTRNERMSLQALKQLLLTCTPIFAGTFLSLLLYNIPKYAMAGVLTDDYQTYYSILFMPSFVITLMCEFLFKPTITTIAELWWENRVREFVRYVVVILLLILGADLVIVAGGHLIGRNLLQLIYGVDLSPYKVDFVILLIGGGFSAEVYMVYNVLIAIRKNQFILPVYALVTILTILPVRWMLRRFSMMGACLNYLYSCCLLFLIFAGILTAVTIMKGKKHG